MKIKTKLTLGVGLLFILIIILSIVGIFNMKALKSDTENILSANYNSLLYSRNILAVLNNPNAKSLEKIEANLKYQESNATEIGEKDVNIELRSNFEEFKLNIADNNLSAQIQQNLYHIMDLNMQAIQRKSEIATITADNAILWISITGALCLLIAFILLINLPASIANPIQRLTESIKQIALKNYSERVQFESHSEFRQLAKSFNTMAEKLEEYNHSGLAKLMKEKKRIETLINNMHDPVIGIDEHLKIIFANQEAIKITGLSDDVLIGKDIQKLAVKNDLIRSLIQDLNDPELKATAETIKIFVEGKEGYFEKETLHIAISPTGEETEELIGHVIILRDITVYKELDLAKTNFIATVSHEFKTPIASIKMSLKLLENKKIGDLNADQENLIESIQEDADRLLKITGELLNMTQVDSGHIQLSIMPSDPKVILQYAINSTQTQADQKQIKFYIDCAENISKIQADNEKTAWVLTNLISNAIRYSYENSTIYLTIKEHNDKIFVSVRDTGRGIAQEYKDKVFNRYFRVPGTKDGGTGLGLAISKEFIEAQGGLIKVDSDLGAGSTFTFSLNKLNLAN